MRTTMLRWDKLTGWSGHRSDIDTANLILYFGSRQALEIEATYRQLRALAPQAIILGCSTGGQIEESEIKDDTIDAVALHFQATRVKGASRPIEDQGRSFSVGEEIGRALAAPDLAGMFVLADGLGVNGSALVAGVTSVAGSVPLTGGLAGDGVDFGQTLAGLDAPPTRNTVAAVGFYGSAIKIGHGSAGGWDVFGPKRQITRSHGNVLIDLDGHPALDLYVRYIGDEEVKKLPASALLFPLRVYDPAHPEHAVVRSVLAVDQEKKTLTFAGDVPEGWTAQLMRGSFYHLTEGAALAAQQSRDGLTTYRDRDGLAILISCIGRRMLMGQRTVDEIEAASEILGPHLQKIGFYSYGEIAPHGVSGVCVLHNQTMTITTITEAAA